MVASDDRGQGGRTTAHAPDAVDSRRPVVGFALFLAGAMAVSSFGIPSFAVLSGFLRADLGLGRTEIGWLVTSLAASTALSGVAAGRLVDLLGGRRVLTGLLAISAVAAGLLAVAPSYGLLIAVAMLAGLANGSNNPATNALVVAHLPVGRRGATVGAKQSGVQLGVFYVGLTLPPLAESVGWRTALLAVVLPAAALTALVPVVVPTSPRVAAARDNASRGPLAAGARRLSVYAFLMGAAGAAVTTFLPLYLHEVLRWTLTGAGVAAAVVGVVGIGSRLALGRWSEGRADEAIVLAGLAAVSVVATIALATAPATGPVAVWFGVALTGVSVAGWNSAVMVAAIRNAPPGQVGRSTGGVVLGFMGGVATGPLLFGLVVDRAGGYPPAWAGAVAVFLLAAAAAGAHRPVRRRAARSS